MRLRCGYVQFKCPCCGRNDIKRQISDFRVGKRFSTDEIKEELRKTDGFLITDKSQINALYLNGGKIKCPHCDNESKDFEFVCAKLFDIFPRTKITDELISKIKNKIDYSEKLGSDQYQIYIENPEEPYMEIPHGELPNDCRFIACHNCGLAMPYRLKVTLELPFELKNTYTPNQEFDIDRETWTDPKNVLPILSHERVADRIWGTFDNLIRDDALYETAFECPRCGYLNDTNDIYHFVPLVSDTTVSVNSDFQTVMESYKINHGFRVKINKEK